jgi:magnesium transporter
MASTSPDGVGSRRRAALTPRRRGGGRARNRGAASGESSGAGKRGGLVDCAVYRDGRRVGGHLDVIAAVQEVRSGGGFIWIGLYEPDESDLEVLAEQFDLHRLPVEDAIKAHQRPKLERYDHQLFAVLKTVRYCSHDELTEDSDIVQTGEVLVFLGSDFIITVRHGSHGGLSDLRARLEDEPELLAHGPSAVLHAVADLVVDNYVEVADQVQDDIDEVEASVFSQRRNRRDVERIYLLKREMLQLKRSITPLAIPLRTLAERPIELIDPQVRKYFRDVEDHLSRVREQVESYDELLSSILQASLAQLSVAENEDMRKITAWAAIIAVPTAIAGIYGMNFHHMPELAWRYSYPVCLLAMAGLCLLLFRGFKRNGWL